MANFLSDAEKRAAPVLHEVGRSHEGRGSAAASEPGLRVVEAEDGTRAIGLLRADGREQDDVGNASSFDGRSYRACAAIAVRAHVG